jgi:hypothetical protein
MQLKDNAASVATDLESYFDEGTYGHAGAVAEVLERLPNGEFAWLRPSSDRAEPDDALYVLTESGRDLVARMRAEEALFGKWPTVAEAG